MTVPSFLHRLFSDSVSAPGIFAVHGKKHQSAEDTKLRPFADSLNQSWKFRLSFWSGYRYTNALSLYKRPEYPSGHGSDIVGNICTREAAQHGIRQLSSLYHTRRFQVSCWLKVYTDIHRPSRAPHPRVVRKRHRVRCCLPSAQPKACSTEMDGRESQEHRVNELIAEIDRRRVGEAIVRHG